MPRSDWQSSCVQLFHSSPGQNLSKATADPAATRHFEVLVNDMAVRPEDLPLERATRGLPVRNHEQVIRFEDGRAIHLYGSAVPLRDQGGAARGAIGAFVDVTRLKQAETALREADRRKDEFLALLSHELRNPLAPILSAAQIMQQAHQALAQLRRKSREGPKMIRRGDRVKLIARKRPRKLPLGAAWSSASPPTKPTRSCCGMVGCRGNTCRSALSNPNQQSWDNSPKR